MVALESSEREGLTRVEQVMQAIRGQIAGRTLMPGAKLPSIRAFAANMGVSKSTVVEAYERLAAEGAIEPRRGSGFYVAGRQMPFQLAEIGPRIDREIDPLWVSRQTLETGDEALKPGCGWLPSSWMPQEAIRRALRLLARTGDVNLTDYGPPAGLLALRGLLARRLAEQGIEAPPRQIVLAESGMRAIDLLCRFLLEPGDTVLVDDPSYFNFHALLRTHRARIVSVPFRPNGPDVEIFARVLAEEKPRLYLTNSMLQNPTGATLSPVVAHKVLRLAEQHGLIIIEDDLFADLMPEPAPRLAAFDGLERVVLVGSFSKTLSASVRCGYIAARADWIEGLTDLRLATSFGGGHFSSALVLALLTDGVYRKHVESLRTRLAHAMGKAMERLKAAGLTPWIEPRAGIFLWCSLPDGLDAAEVARRALAENVVLAPGNAFSPSQSAPGYFRFNVAQSLDPRLYQVLERAMRAPSA